MVRKDAVDELKKEILVRMLLVDNVVKVSLENRQKVIQNKRTHLTRENFPKSSSRARFYRIS